jgi:protein-S-isoprenylcysteine O-methyltransferase Ste14
VSWPDVASVPLLAAGTALAALGCALAVAGAAALGRSLTPFPRPHAHATLRRRGVLRLVRHPIYGGGLLIALGWSLAAAPLGVAVTAALAVFFAGKSRREEAWLAERYPDYAAYRERTPRRLVPWVW